MDQYKLFCDLSTLGRLFTTVSNNDRHFADLSLNADTLEKFYASFALAEIKNPWFTQSNIQKAFSAWGSQLNYSELTKWSQGTVPPSQKRTIAIIAAGNIPLVALHDVISVLVSGNRVLLKLSGDDEVLMKGVVELFYHLDEEYRELILIAEGPLKNFDGVIATGSYNTARYFEYYFGKYPHLIRKNRTSLAVLTGTESERELELLGSDIFTYFGMGCRNVSHLLVPEGYNFNGFFLRLFFNTGRWLIIISI